MSSFKLQARIAAGRLYAAGFSVISRLLRLIPSDSWLGRQKHRLALSLRPQPKRKLMFLYSALAKTRQNASFIQIGANDGIMSDPLHEFVMSSAWRGIFIEPVPYLFERLIKNYPQRPGLVFENVAIASQNGSRPFYYLRPDDKGDIPDWHIGLGSFLREVVVAHAYIIPDIESRLVEQEVPCVTFDSLCAKHAVQSIDVLQMDTEGYDYEIIKTINFDRYRPKILTYEQHLLSAADRAVCTQGLENHGYEIMVEGLDAICFNVRDATPEDASLLDVWKVLKKTDGIPA